MLTNSGQAETILSTSEGGLTFVTTPQSMHMSNAFKGDQLLSESSIHQTSSLSSPSITVLSTGNNSDLNEVVYSVAEVAGGTSQVKIVFGGFCLTHCFSVCVNLYVILQTSPCI